MMISNKNFLNAQDIADLMQVSTGYAYRIIRELNAELKSKGYHTVQGRLSRAYFEEKMCYGGIVKEE